MLGGYPQEWRKKMTNKNKGQNPFFLGDMKVPHKEGGNK
jgi:hypothetical protein